MTKHIFTLDVSGKTATGVQKSFDGVLDQLTYDDATHTATVEYAKVKGGYEKPVSVKLENRHAIGGNQVDHIIGIKIDIDRNKKADNGDGAPVILIRGASGVGVGSSLDSLDGFTSAMVTLEAKRNAANALSRKFGGSDLTGVYGSAAAAVDLDFSGDKVNDQMAVTFFPNGVTLFSSTIFPTRTQ